MAEITDKAIAWLVSNDTGVSSKTLCALLYGVPLDDALGRHPSDSYDFGRCKRFLAALAPAQKERALRLAKSLSPEWKALAEEWGRLESIPDHPALYAQMKKIIGKAREGG